MVLSISLQPAILSTAIPTPEKQTPNDRERGSSLYWIELTRVRDGWNTVPASIEGCATMSCAIHTHAHALDSLYNRCVEQMGTVGSS